MAHTMFYSVTVSIGLLIFVTGVLAAIRKGIASISKTANKTRPSGEHVDPELLALGRAAWSTAEATKEPHFELLPQDVDVAETAEIARRMLMHVRRVAPGLAVPTMVPRVRLVATFGEAGHFKVDRDGCVSIDLDSRFGLDHNTVVAILAHEMCHYVLENSGIRQAVTIENERLTDICMFVVGFGQVFLRGYHSRLEYRPGYRPGYLGDKECGDAMSAVRRLRNENLLDLPTRTRVLERNLTSRVGDLRVRDRLVLNMRNRHPDWTEQEIYAYVVDQFERDRRSVGMAHGGQPVCTRHRIQNRHLMPMSPFIVIK
jgi:hypothetical protein